MLMPYTDQQGTGQVEDLNHVKRIYSNRPSKRRGAMSARASKTSVMCSDGRNGSHSSFRMYA
ncbi:hypothetical protein DPMN_110652 [Dreissena polymorpha]|uniref:Uncharacterized protein n=1 Tax=Dreissena polymorpha TaxID=45954 RepID=A0A9D4QNA4_DREPO|nr:hypothetical protein DPMN_110652 [Dreissena polymorpha]